MNKQDHFPKSIEIKKTIKQHMNVACLGINSSLRKNVPKSITREQITFLKDDFSVAEYYAKMYGQLKNALNITHEEFSQIFPVIEFKRIREKIRIMSLELDKDRKAERQKVKPKKEKKLDNPENITKKGTQKKAARNRVNKIEESNESLIKIDTSNSVGSIKSDYTFFINALMENPLYHAVLNIVLGIMKEKLLKNEYPKISKTPFSEKIRTSKIKASNIKVTDLRKSNYDIYLETITALCDYSNELLIQQFKSRVAMPTMQHHDSNMTVASKPNNIPSETNVECTPYFEENKINNLLDQNQFVRGANIQMENIFQIESYSEYNSPMGDNYSLCGENSIGIEKNKGISYDFNY